MLSRWKSLGRILERTRYGWASLQGPYLQAIVTDLRRWLHMAPAQRLLVILIVSRKSLKAHGVMLLSACGCQDRP